MTTFRFGSAAAAVVPVPGTSFNFRQDELQFQTRVVAHQPRAAELRAPRVRYRDNFALQN